jgi:subtilisin-like proprotein convertase family protein
MGVDHEPPLSNLATVTLTVTPVNDWPLAAHDAYTLTEDTPLYEAAPGLLTNDIEIDGDPMIPVLLDAPDHGPLTLRSDGSFIYTPTFEYSGADSFSYRADDGSVTGTLAYWPLDEGSGSAVYDLTGNGHTGTLINTPIFTSTVPPTTTFANANALSFDGSNAYVNLGSLPSPAGEPARTVCIWTKAESTSGTRSALDYGALELWREGTTLHADSAGNTDLSVPGFWDTNWHHLCVTYDGATARLFADGVQRAAAARSWDLDPQTAYLGRSDAPHDPVLYWTGLLDDARIYDRALERWEIVALAAGDYHLDLANVSLTITPVNDPPVAHADVYTPTEDTVLTVAAPGVLGNDQDVENDPLIATVVLTPAHGAFAFDASGAFTYTPNVDFDGTDAFTYYANDGELDSNPVTVALDVASVNDTPLAQDDAYTTPEDTLLNVPAPGVLTNDNDVDGDTLQATVIQSPTMGALTLAGNGSLLYEPPLEYSGVTSFTYKVSDGALHDFATVAITITAVNDPPVAQDDAYTTDMDIPLVVGAPGLLGNDSDAEGTMLKASLTTSPTHGTADVVLDGAFIYTPTLSFFGVDTFDYQASDGVSRTPAVVTITVNGPPTTGDVAVFTQEDIPATIRLIPDHANDPEGDTLTMTAVGTPITGATALSGTTGVYYTPAPDFTGVEIFTYTVADPRGLTASAWITVTVGGVNDPPVAVDDQLEISEDHAVSISVLDNDHDLEATLQLVGITTPAQGSAEIEGRAVRYTPLPDFYGVDGFTYTISDGVLTATARVTITVTSVNDLPTLDPLADLALEPDAGEQVVTLSGIDTGADNEPQPLDVTAASSNPSLIPDPSISYDGASTTGELRFTPTAGLTGSATVSVTVSDGLSETLRAFDVTVWDATGPFAYVAAGDAGMMVIDLSRPEMPRTIATLPTPGVAQDITLVGDTAYVAAGAAGLMIVDVSAPIQPVRLAVVATPGFAGSASVVEDQVFIADGYTGVALVDASDPAVPTLVSSSDTPGYANRLTAVGRTLYVADSNGGLRTFNTEVPPGRATACDRAGNCTTVEATVLQTLNATAEVSSVPTTEVRILNAPPVLMDTAPLTVTGKAFAESASLQAITLTLGSSTLFTQSWASGTVSATIWNAFWDPAGLSDGPHRLHAALTTWDGTQVSDILTVTLDTQPPQLTVATTELTHTHYRASGALVLEGIAADAGGVARVDLLSGDESHAAMIEGQTWEVPWYLPTDALPDGETFTVTVRATDIAGRVKHITPTLRVDVAPPSPPTLTLRSGQTLLPSNAIVREFSPTLTLDWTTSRDGSGAVTYDVEWLVNTGGTQRVVTGTRGTARTATYAVPEASKIAVRLGARDLYGQTRWERVGPVYVDGPRTPDYVGWRGASPYRGWMESGCTLLGVDRRIKRNTLDTGTLNHAQRFYGTWDANTLRLAWTGTHWGASATESGDGDLFLYLDTMPGGTTTTFDPYGVATRTLHLPGVTPTGTVNAMNADALVWVRDAETALLLRWQDARGHWQIQGPLSDVEYQYDAEVNGGQTDLILPFDRIGLAAGGSLDLVAFAAEEGSLDLWATLPNANPLSSGRVVETAAFADTDARFALLHRYHWDRVSAGVCPNGSDGTSPAYPDTEVQAQLSATPPGVAYSLLDSDLFWLWEQLAGNKPADVSSFFQMMSTDHPHIGGNQTLTYTLRTRNAGAEPATGLYAKVSAHYALHLTPGYAERWVPLGNLAPGEDIHFSFQAVVDLVRSSEPWAAVTVELYDDAHPDSGPPLERLWLDHQVDRAAPAFVGITQPAYVLGARSHRVQGYSYDESGVPMLSLNLDDGTSLDCPDDTPADGGWTCILDASGYQDGDMITARVEAEDAFGQRSDLSAPRRWVVDTTPPTATLTAPADATLPLVAETLQLAGRLTDTYGLAGAEVCVADTCTPASVLLFGAERARVVSDVPDAPLPISGGACSMGSGIARMFSVTDSFTLGQVSVGFAATHPRRDDLDVTLIAPSGTAVPLLTDDGLSGTDFQHYNVWLDDTANGPYASRADDTAELTFARRARPVSPLADFNGEDAVGDWQLVICDRDPAANHGAYLGSRLSLTPTPMERTARTGTWSYTFNPEEALDYEIQELRVVGVDLVGNRTADSVALSLMVDNVAPVLTVTHIVTSTPFTKSIDVLGGGLFDGSLAAGGKGLQLSALIEGPNETYHESIPMQGTNWLYTLKPSVPGTYRISVTAYDGAGNTTTVGPYAVEVTPWHHVYFPLVAKQFLEAPDLVIERIDAGPQGVQVVIANQGNAPVSDSFWVDLYVDPTVRPYEVNETWEQVGTQGAAWGVTTPLEAGDALTLTIGDAHYQAAYSWLSWPLVTGTHVYAQVDSAGGSVFGGVYEDHETLGLGYNNILGTKVTTTTTAYYTDLRVYRIWDLDGGKELPSRR